MPTKNYAAAWLQDKGKGLVIGNVQSYTSCNYWDLESNLQSGPCFRQFSINPYFEYGVLSNFTLIINPVFLDYSQADQSSPFALGYITVGGRFLINKKDYDTISFQAEYNQPFKSSNFGSNPSSQSTIANEEKFLDLRILYGTGGAYGRNQHNEWYADAEAAVRPYFGVTAAELHFDFMLGWKILDKRFIFEIQELNTISLYAPKDPSKPNFNLCTAMLSVIYFLQPSLGLQGGVKQDFYGTNIGRGTAPFVAIWFKF
jgi:hypothetical protein